MSHVIAVDLDGTLAHYEGFVSPTDIGDPIPAMAARVREWLEQGVEVWIFSARISHPQDGDECAEAIEAWSERHFGKRLKATCVKSYRIVEFWDDRAVSVETNTGRVLTEGRA